MMGVMYSAGRGVPKDDFEAARWFHRAAADRG
jgi:TPR repeat protein